jgi:REP element-mobilizing transposase RayT
MGAYMGQVFYKLFYHVIWRTKFSEPTITKQIESVLFPFLKNKAKRFGCYIHEIDGIPDHVHAAITIPPAASVSDIIGKLKGSSSYFLNKELGITSSFSWQDGFGIFSFSENDLQGIVEYIRNQKHHHKIGSLKEFLEKTDSDLVA